MGTVRIDLECTVVGKNCFLVAFFCGKTESFDQPCIGYLGTGLERVGECFYCLGKSSQFCKRKTLMIECVGISRVQFKSQGKRRHGIFVLDETGLRETFPVDDICPLWFKDLGRLEHNDGLVIILQTDKGQSFLVECIGIVRGDLERDIEGDYCLVVHPDCTKGYTLVIECRSIPGNQIQDLIKGFNGLCWIVQVDERKSPVKICQCIGLVQFNCPVKCTDRLVVLFKI